MATFRKRPVVIEAVRFDGIEQVDDTPAAMFEGSFCPPQEWLQEALAMHEAQIGAVFADYDNGDVLKVHTLEGDMIAQPGDWIIRGVNGELYPCKPDIFEKTYEAVQP